MSAPLVCLASRSPRRRALLAQIGVAHSLDAADIDESWRAGEAADDYVVRIAQAKAHAVAARRPDHPVLAADTVVVVDGLICGKPADEEDGLAMLRSLSGRTHQVLTAVALLAPPAPAATAVSSSEVTFRPLSAAECLAYWRTGEGRDKAGGYAIQGLAAVFVERLSGSYSGVMGLPLFETAQLLRAAGLAYWNAPPHAERRR